MLSDNGPIGHIIKKGGESLLLYRELIDLATQAEFCTRLRTVHPFIFVLTILTHRSAHSVPTIRELWHSYVKITGFEEFDPASIVKYQSFYSKFNANLVTYFKLILNLPMIRLENASNL